MDPKMYRVLSSTKRENGTLEWGVSIRLEKDDALKLARELAQHTRREVEIVEAGEVISFIHPCGGCLHLEIGSCPGKEYPCEEFKRFK